MITARLSPKCLYVGATWAAHAFAESCRDEWTEQPTSKLVGNDRSVAVAWALCAEGLADPEWDLPNGRAKSLGIKLRPAAFAFLGIMEPLAPELAVIKEMAASWPLGATDIKESFPAEENHTRFRLQVLQAFGLEIGVQRDSKLMKNALLNLGYAPILRGNGWPHGEKSKTVDPAFAKDFFDRPDFVVQDAITDLIARTLFRNEAEVRSVLASIWEGSEVAVEYVDALGAGSGAPASRNHDPFYVDGYQKKLDDLARLAAERQSDTLDDKLQDVTSPETEEPPESGNPPESQDAPESFDAARFGVFQVKEHMVVAHSEAAQASLAQAAIDVRALVRVLKQYPEAADTELRLVSASLSGIALLLDEGAFSPPAVTDTRSRLTRFLEENPDVKVSVELLSVLATLIGIATAIGIL